MLEDDRNVSGFVKEVVSGRSWDFFLAERVAEAPALASKFRPDLMLLDVNLPDGNGYQALAQIRRDPALVQVPAIFLTSQGDVQSRVMGFSAGGQDYVSKPFAVEELLARMQAHLAIKQRQDNLSRNVEELTLLDRVRRDTADMIVHDLREQVGSIRITLELVLQSGLIAEGRYQSILRGAEMTSQFMLLMINDLLDLSAQRLRVEPAPVDFDALFGRLKILFTPKLDLRKVVLRLPPTAALNGFPTDGTLIFRILANLISNSIKFSGPGAEIAVEMSPAGSGMRIEVLDRGPGIPDEEKGKIFLKWHRADTPESRATIGSGIGLAFCSLAASGLGGRIHVEDRPGGGSRFVIEFPRARA